MCQFFHSKSFLCMDICSQNLSVDRICCQNNRVLINMHVQEHLQHQWATLQVTG